MRDFGRLLVAMLGRNQSNEEVVPDFIPPGCKGLTELFNLTAPWWHLHEVFVNINGDRHCLWRAVDNEGEVLC